MKIRDFKPLQEGNIVTIKTMYKRPKRNNRIFKFDDVVVKGKITRNDLSKWDIKVNVVSVGNADREMEDKLKQGKWALHKEDIKEG